MNSVTPTTKPAGLGWPQLTPGILVKRYKRFLADVRLKNGDTVVAHCPNSGRMTSCCKPGRNVYLSYHDNPRRKLKYTWEMIEMPSSLVGVNTLVPNRLVALSIETGQVESLRGYDRIKKEVKVGKHTRLDLVLQKDARDQCYVEIKNCTLVENGIAQFPDAVTARGLKHLETLRQLVSDGYQGVIFYLIQRTDATLFKPADSIDLAYGKALRQAAADGVKILVYDVHINLQTIMLNKEIPYLL